MIILNCYNTYGSFFKQHDTDLKEEMDNNIKDFLQNEDLQKQCELILNFSPAKRKKFLDYSLLHLDSYKYIMEIRKIVKENNFDVKDYEERIFVRVVLGETIEIDSEEES